MACHGCGGVLRRSDGAAAVVVVLVVVVVVVVVVAAVVMCGGAWRCVMVCVVACRVMVMVMVVIVVLVVVVCGAVWREGHIGKKKRDGRGRRRGGPGGEGREKRDGRVERSALHIECGSQVIHVYLSMYASGDGHAECLGVGTISVTRLRGGGSDRDFWGPGFKGFLFS